MESRWGRRAGTVLAASGVLLAVASATHGAPTVEDRPPPGCEGMTAHASEGHAWYALDPVVERGTLVAHRLRLGTIGGPGWSVALPAEAWATGPVAGQVLFGSDDGRASTIARFDAVRGCIEPIAVVPEVVRSAILDPAGDAIHEHRLARADRADLGIWVRRPGAHATERQLPPPGDDDRFGPTWRTDLAWSDDARSLVVATCGELACRFRVADRTGLVRSVDDPDLGALVGMVDGRLVVRGACRGLPCPVLSIDPATDDRTVLDPAGGSAALDAGGTSLLIADVPGRRHGALRTIDLRTGRSRAVPTDDLPVQARSGSGAELPPGWFLVAPSHPGDGAAALRARPIDGPSRPLHEVRP